MPFCPECEYEYEKDVTVCPDCATPLVERLDERNDYICDECKELLSEGEPWCPGCGTIFIDTLRCFRHPACPAHGRCVLCGQYLCRDCAVQHTGRYFCEKDAQIDTEPGEPEATPTPRDWEAEMFGRYLEREGISCRLFSPDDVRRLLFQGDVSGVKLIVPRAYRHGVERVFKERDIKEEVVLYECERCSAICTKNETICPNCKEKG